MSDSQSQKAGSGSMLLQSAGNIQIGLSYADFKLAIAEASEKIVEEVWRRAKQMLQDAGVKPAAVPLKTVVPLLQHASLENDERLTERWAALLANAANPHAAVNVRPVMAETLKQLTPLDAELMDFFYNFVVKEFVGWSELRYVPSIPNAITGILLPEVRGSEVDPSSPDQPSGSVTEVDLSLASLIALGLITEGRDPLRVGSAYFITIFGFEFVSACRRPTKSAEGVGSE